MNLRQYKELAEQTILEPMRTYMEEWDDCGYDIEYVDACRKRIAAYLEDLAALSAPTNDEIMDLVKTLVLILNELNEETDYSLIETDAREALCELIQSSAIDCGLTDYDDDITEEWREW